VSIPKLGRIWREGWVEEKLFQPIEYIYYFVTSLTLTLPHPGGRKMVSGWTQINKAWIERPVKGPMHCLGPHTYGTLKQKSRGGGHAAL